MSSPARYGPESARLLEEWPGHSGRATVHGTFGELLQGYRQQPGGGYEHFLFTFPVLELRATSTVSLSQARHPHEVRPADRTRALTATADLARALGLNGSQLSIAIDSNIPVGKG